MLFNSYEFIFIFLPITLLVFFYIGRNFSGKTAAASLVVASLFFYAWWNAAYVTLLLLSMVVNYITGYCIKNSPDRGRRSFVIIGITFNLLLLGYFKYANFFVENIASVFENDLTIAPIILPLAISFFTFQQIAYLVDVYKGKISGYGIIEYSLFVSFFPQLIAGPIVHHAQVMPQFIKQSFAKIKIDEFAAGLSIFAIGLFKKVVLADGIATYANTAFKNAATVSSLDFLAAWGGALSYTFQLYFDFSGYSDMAIGIALFFGITLPVNFYSPYKAQSIIEFWRRWHITLSSFLRDYVYIPLGGNRHGHTRRYANLIATMVLGGLWHGAAWTFVFWGLLHGAYLMINHAWHLTKDHIITVPLIPKSVSHFLSWGCTFFAIVIGWVFFRADSFSTAVKLIKGMLGTNGISVPQALATKIENIAPNLLELLQINTYLGGGSVFIYTWAWIALLAFIAFFLPNTIQLMAKFNTVFADTVASNEKIIKPTSKRISQLQWKPTMPWAILIAIVFAIAILSLNSASEFLYFRF